MLLMKTNGRRICNKKIKDYKIALLLLFCIINVFKDCFMCIIILPLVSIKLVFISAKFFE